MVPFLHKMSLKMRHAVGTSTLIGFPIAIVGAVTYALASELPDAIHWPALVAISVAGLGGAPLGVRLSTKVESRTLQRIFSVILVIVALRMLR